ncbi:MAG: ExbD/TolR family protein [Chthoniobacterales bacterium]|jgi:biopolymer transport protein ExbD
MSDAAPKRGKKKRREPEPEADPEFQIAPMIDILLVLLVFFMSISSTEVLQSNKDIRLPVAKDAKDAKENPGQIIVNLAVNPINNAVGISVNEIDYPTPGDLIPVLQNHIEKNPMVRVLIRADKEVRYATMKSLLEAVGKAGIANVTFSVVDKEAAPTPS